MRQNTYMSQRAAVALDRFLCSSASDPRTSRGLDKLAEDIAKADAAEPEVPPCLMQQLRPAPGDLVREIADKFESVSDEEDPERWDSMS